MDPGDDDQHDQRGAGSGGQRVAVSSRLHSARGSVCRVPAHFRRVPLLRLQTPTYCLRGTQVVIFPMLSGRVCSRMVTVLAVTGRIGVLILVRSAI